MRDTTMDVNIDLTNLPTCIIDDDEIMLMQLENVLKQAGFNHIRKVVSNIGLSEKLPFIIEHDCLFLDINMPQMDGVEVLRALAQLNYEGHIVLFSGENDDLLRSAVRIAETKELNVLGSIPKPASLALVKKIFSAPHQHSEIKSVTKQHIYSKSELIEALEKMEFIPYFQPKVSVKTKEVKSFEVLARWKKDQEKILAPNIFIPLLENYNLMHQFTISLFEQTVKNLSKIVFNGKIYPISFNISASSLEDLNLPDILANIMKKYQLSNNLVTIEITESTVVDKLSISLDVLTRMRIKGFGLSIDDFGTGYSSMELLHKIPFTELKIDQQFVHNASEDESARAILEFCSSLGKNLDLQIVAEGVENDDDWDSATDAGCDEIQGYFVAKPMPLDKVTLWQKTYNDQIDNIE